MRLAPKENFRCPFKYQGQYYDSEVELCYNRFRYYHPEIGRYISEDPIKLLGGFNVFAYVSDSNAWVDVWGLLADFIVTPEGTIVATNSDLNLVSTTDDKSWFQIHFSHEHDGLKPHTHYPEKNDKNTNRRYRETTADDINFANKMLKENKLRHRNGRKDKGGYR